MWIFALYRPSFQSPPSFPLLLYPVSNSSLNIQSNILLCEISLPLEHQVFTFTLSSVSFSFHLLRLLQFVGSAICLVLQDRKSIYFLFPIIQIRMGHIVRSGKLNWNSLLQVRIATVPIQLHTGGCHFPTKRCEQRTIQLHSLDALFSCELLYAVFFHQWPSHVQPRDGRNELRPWRICFPPFYRCFPGMDSKQVSNKSRDMPGFTE